MRLAIGVVLVIVGAVWALQGLDVSGVPQSFMTGSSTWVVAGSLAVALGGLLILSVVRKRGRR